MVHPQQYLELGARREIQRLDELDYGHGRGVPASWPPVGAPSGVVGAVDHEVGGAHDALTLLVETGFPLLLEAAHGLRKVRGGVAERDLLPFVAVRSLGAYLQFAQCPRAVLTASGTAELEITMGKSL